MKVILLSELRGKGGEGDVIDVADGFANNWLFPQKIAIRATAGNLKQLEQKRAGIARREVVRVADANQRKEQLDGKAVRVIRKKS
ncbi:MAG: 50S ribosomal protein L9 [Thermoguttaceae bacterium]